MARSTPLAPMIGADAVASRFRAKINHRHADAARGRIEDRIRIGETGGKGVDEAVAVVAGVDPHLAADIRHTEAVAIAADARDDARDDDRDDTESTGERSRVAGKAAYMSPEQAGSGFIRWESFDLRSTVHPSRNGVKL